MSLSPSGIPYLTHTWNPGGFGCSAGCRTCWARRQAARMPATFCRDCRAFRVHWHAERLDAPARRRKPAVIGVQFTGDLFDPQRPSPEIQAALAAAAAAPWHTYVWLTQQPGLMAEALSISLDPGMCAPDNWFLGLTVRTDLEARQRMPTFAMTCPGRRWVSVEPAWDEPTLAPRAPWAFGGIEGIVIGHDNTRQAPHADWRQLEALAAAATRHDCRVFVKQLWLSVPRRPCGPVGSSDGLSYRLCRDPAEFPPGLQRHELPWALPPAPGQTR